MIYVRMYVRTYVRTYVRSSAQARTSRRSLRRRRRLEVYARARIQYRLCRRTLALGACETRFIAFTTRSSRSFLDRFSTQGEMLHVYVYTCTHAYVEFHVYVYAYAHARMRRLVMVWRWYERRPWPARGKICACAFLVYIHTCT